MPTPADGSPLLLAIDTSTTRAGLALYDGDLLAEVIWPVGRHGSRTVLAAAAHMLALAGRRPSDLTAVAVALGPGSFSGLRVGLSAAKGLAYARACPLLGIPTLEIVAYPHRAAGLTVWAVLEAGRARIVAAPYATTPDGWRVVADPFHGAAADLADQVVGPALVSGEVPPALLAAWADRPAVTILSPALRARRPGALAELAWARLQTGQADDLVTLEPIYLHGKDAV